MKNMIAPYQYVLNVPEEPDEDEKYTVMGMLQKFLTPSLKTNEKSAEKFCLNSMKNCIARSGRRDHNGLWNRGRQCVCKRGTSN